MINFNNRAFLNRKLTVAADLRVPGTSVKEFCTTSTVIVAIIAIVGRMLVLRFIVGLCSLLATVRSYQFKAPRFYGKLRPLQLSCLNKL